MFNSVSASSLILGSTTFKDSQITGSISIQGSLTTTGNITIDGDATVDGTLTVRELHTEFVSASIMFASGSTQFGDTLDDTHQFSGSVLLSGSLSLNNYSVTEISKTFKFGVEPSLISLSTDPKILLAFNLLTDLLTSKTL